MKRKRALCVFALVLITSSLQIGCLTIAFTHKVKYGRITTEKIKIVAKDKSFTLRSGQLFKTPFHVKMTFDDYKRLSINSSLLQNYNKFLRRGLAKNVIVYYDEKSKPLYGIITFAQVQSSHQRKGVVALRSHRIVIPQSYINGALSGNIQVLYEKYRIEINGNNFTIISSLHKRKEVPNWILWISNAPFN